MKRFRNLFAGLFYFTMGLFILASCSDDDPTPLQGAADVFIQDLKTEDGIKYAISVYASANYEIKSATVTAPGEDGEVYELAAASTKYQFSFIPETDDYSSELPEEGIYSIEIVSTGDEKITVTDALGDEKLAPIAIKTTVMENDQLKTTWDEVESTDAYAVRLYTENREEMIFSGETLDPEKTEYEFGESTNGWLGGQTPAADTDYVVELVGIKYKTEATGSNIEFLTLDSKTITWE